MPEKKPSSVTGPNVQKLSMQRNLAVSGLAGIALSAISCLAAIAADGSPIPLKSITLDGQKQLVVEFSTRGGAFPTVPHLLDLPGPNHRVVVDLTGATIEKGTLQTPEELSAEISKAVPAIKSLRYYNQANTEKPTARIVLDLPEALKAEPRVVKVDESSVTIDLGADLANATAEKPVHQAEAPQGEAPIAAAAAAATEAVNPIADTAAAPTPFAAAEANAAAAAAEATTSGITKLAQPETVTTTSKAGSGWDWSGNANTPTATPNELKPASGAAMQPAATSQVAETLPQTGDTVDGVAPATATRTAAQPAAAADVAELRPAIGSAVAPAISAPVEQPLSAQPVGAAAVVSTPVATATPTGAKASVKLYNSAVRNHLAGKLPDAINDYKGAIAANPQLAEAHSNLGLIYNQQHNYAQALVEFRKALAINPKDAITYNGIGAALRAERDLPGAIKNWQTAVQLDPHLATAHYNLGTAFEIQKDYDRALDAYKEAVKNDYRLGEAYYRMGLIQSEKKHQNEEALTQFKEALKISSDSEYSDDARSRIAQFSKTPTAKH